MNQIIKLTLTAGLLACCTAIPVQAEVDLSTEIDRAVKDGSISSEAATELKAQQQKIAEREKSLRAKHDGKLSANDEKDINKRVEKLQKKLAHTRQIAANNTGKNVGDNRVESPNPLVQSREKPDIDMTAKLRKSIVKDSKLSSNAKNIKIVTIKGVVTLRGVVDSAQEKDQIDSLAKNMAGSGNVLNELTVAEK